MKGLFKLTMMAMFVSTFASGSAFAKDYLANKPSQQIRQVDIFDSPIPGTSIVRMLMPTKDLMYSEFCYIYIKTSDLNTIKGDGSVPEGVDIGQFSCSFKTPKK